MAKKLRSLSTSGKAVESDSAPGHVKSSGMGSVSSSKDTANLHCPLKATLL